ncbi:hypothetical protein M422DRAFT_33768 [Sphaerobolus stellatus SS14]|uniref:RWD domain-containing protein n=1 Tax=Sphaerobolus stellatus (strain SS14) TaxID=990650 RepID=A0A0C9VIS2_SPHS4|nr:hypothetical protein M422DRAFT_33768 [Sphaerobolus stellatus SS14]
MSLSSRPASPLPADHVEKLNEYIQALYVDREPIASELEVLSSIYGETAIRLWGQNGSGTIRYEVDTNLTQFEDVPLQILVSLSPAYPATAPPQLQLLSRYIGAFSVDQELFGEVLKTFISSKSGIEFVPDSVAVFDGIQSVIERCSTWYSEKLSEEKAGELLREEERSLRHANEDEHTKVSLPPAIDERIPIQSSMPEGIEIIEAEPIIDRKSAFVGRACRITHPSQVGPILSYLLSDKRIARAAHPIINAWRCSVDGVMHQDNDDDGETAAGGRMAHLLQIMELDHVLVIVTRYFGGILLGADRFKHINQAARAALERGRFLDAEDKPKSSTKQNTRRRN